jgi:hypothetical protein
MWPPGKTLGPEIGLEGREMVTVAVPVGREGGPGPEVGVKKSLRAAEGGVPVSIFYLYPVFILIVTVQVPAQGELNRWIFPIEMPSVETLNPHMKHPSLTLQILGFLIRAIVLRKGPQ